MSWGIFSIVILIALIIDLNLHKQTTLSSALGWSLFWILLALGFNGWVYFAEGHEAALNFFTSYIVEKSLSVDNLFVFLLIFKAFSIPARLRHKVLFWGVIGAIAMRALFIAGGIALVHTFEFIFYIFGLFLIYTAYKLAFQKDEELHPEQNPLILWFEKWMPLDAQNKSDHFFIKKKGKWFATSLFLALLSVEISDLIFALDSIPAVLGITTDPLIAFTSNIFAILGLRSLYFLLEKSLDYFHYLHLALAAILAFIGFKMLLADFIHVPIGFSLGFITTTLVIAIIASCIAKKK